MDLLDPNPRPQLLSPLYGTHHLLSIALLVAGIVLLVSFRAEVRKLRANRNLWQGLAWFMLVDQVLLHVLYWSYDYQPYADWVPLHLCATLIWVVPIAMIRERVEWIRFVSIWAIGSGTMAVVNMNITYYPVLSYVFLHFMWMHYFLVWVPVALMVIGEIRMTYGYFLTTLIGLTGYAFIIFLVNWAFDTNYMYTGPNNDVPIPFLPPAFLRWPVNFLSFTMVGVALFHAVFGLMKLGSWMGTVRKPDST